MKQFFKIFFASLLAVIVAGVILFGVVSGMMISAVSSIGEKPSTEAASNSILKIDLQKGFGEQGQKNSFATFTDESSYSAGLYDAIKAIEHAATDANIKGIYIKMDAAPMAWATAQQLRDALSAFRKSKKFIYAYGEIASQKAYFIASAADSIFLNPTGMIEMSGLVTSIPFFKGTLDKLDLQPEIFYAGKFKSATEPFRAEKASEPNKQQIRAYQDDIWNQFLKAVSEHTGSDTGTVNSWVQSGAVQFPADALQYKIVNGLYYEDQVIDLLKNKLGIKEDGKLKVSTIDDYAYAVKSNRKSEDDRIGLLVAEGEIMSGKANGQQVIASEDLVKSIRSLRDNEKIKAVVMRVNSPGGSALASDVILRELELLQKKKPLVVSMGDLAASGGYYISCKANKIFALPTTLTGSIGVFAMMFNTSSMLKNKLGINVEHIKNAPYADFPSATRPLENDEAQRMQAYVDTIYNQFKNHVAQGRKLAPELVDSFAQGRVWTGEDALAIGLVDKIGGLNEAIKEAATLAKLKTYSISTYPEPQDKFEQMLKRYGKNAGAALAADAIEQQLGREYSYYKDVQALVKRHKQAMAIMPFIVRN